MMSFKCIFLDLENLFWVNQSFPEALGEQETVLGEYMLKNVY